MPSQDPLPIDRPPSLRAALTRRSVGVTVLLAVAAAGLLNPIFVTPFTTLLGRTLVIGLVLLLAFAAARRVPTGWMPTWLPSWLLPAGAVALAAPLFTAATYVITSGGDIDAFTQTKARVLGFLWLAGLAMILSLITVAAALTRERLAKAERRTLALELERSRLEKQAAQAQLALLQAQIEPHFLFNTLANVQALVENNSPRAAGVLQSLIAYLRAALPRLHHAEPTLGNELALVSAYLELMQLRMPDRLQFTVDVAPALHALRFPSMALLTLVENAVRHGIDPSEEGGRIDVGGAGTAATGSAPGRWQVWVADSGVGMQPSAAPGTGLGNLRARLAAFFGADAALLLGEQAPRGLRAEITWSGQ